MDSEEGEIYESKACSPSTIDYDPAYEWPGDSSDVSTPCSEPFPTSQSSVKKLRPNQPSFRLVVLRTSILSSNHRLAIIDGYSEIQFGRDVVPAGSSTPKIRLKEMEVSKLHATAYWDSSRREWSVVDMGSMHGTFLQRASVMGSDAGVRLSPPRQASIPWALHHLDRLTIGGTAFLIHIHKDKFPCGECSSIGDEIPLFPMTRTSKLLSAERLPASEVKTSPVSYTSTRGKDPKKALIMLKHSLLTRHNDITPPVDNSVVQYMDRSARRRALGPASHPDTPGVSLPSSIWSDSPPCRVGSSSLELITSEVTLPQPSKPLPASNIGHRLLMKQGWEPGTALGLEVDPSEGRIGLVEPLEVSASVNRGGLGLKRSSNTGFSEPLDWKEGGKRKRYKEIDLANN